MVLSIVLDREVELELIFIMGGKRFLGKFMVVIFLNVFCNLFLENFLINRDKLFEDGCGEFLVGRVGGMLFDEVVGLCCGGLDVMMVLFFC